MRDLEIKIENLQRIVLQSDRLNLAEKKGKVQEEIEKKTQRLVRKWKKRGKFFVPKIPAVAYFTYKHRDILSSLNSFVSIFLMKIYLY